MSDDILDFLNNLDDLPEENKKKQENERSDPKKNVISENNSFKSPENKQNQRKTEPIDTSRYLDDILKTSGVEEKKAELIRALDSKLSCIDNLNDVRDEDKKNLKQLNKEFWKIYKQTVLKYVSKNDPQAMRLFLEFGIIDSVMVKKDDLEFLNHFSINSEITEEKKHYNIVSLFDWLRLIYEGKQNPSTTEMGITYDKYLREKERRQTTAEKKAADALTEDEKNLHRVGYEVDNMVTSVGRLLLTSPTSSPLFYNSSVITDARKEILTPEKVKEVFEKIRQRDFSLFYRETLFKMTETSKDIISVEVLPHVILFPVCGDKVFCWQEFSSTQKTSRARIIIPVFFTGDLEKELIKAMGQFRWELCRSVKGAQWMDPVDGGITGAFYDFVTYYKKNNKISLDAKEKIKELISRNRKDPKRVFISQYAVWVQYESRGTMKMDRFTREIFFRYMPFPYDIRRKIERIPVYADLIRKYENRAKKQKERLEMRYKKKRDADGNLPAPLQENLDYISS